MATTRKAAPAKKGFQHKEDTGALFYDVPGVPTMSGSIQRRGSHSVTAEPAVDKNQRDYIRITGDGVSGALYVNDRKDNERHPDLTGPIEIDGQQLRVAAWKRQTQSGKNAGQEFLSVSISEKRSVAS